MSTMQSSHLRGMKMDTPGNIFQSRWYNINRVMLSMVGQWPFQNVKARCFILSIVLFISLTQFLTKILALVTLRHNFDGIIECVAPLIVDINCVVKQTFFMLNLRKFRMLYMKVQKDWKSWIIKSEFEIMQEFADKGRRISVSYTCFIYGLGGLFPLMPVIPKLIGANITSPYSTKPVGLPYHVEYYFIDLEKYFYPVLAHCYLAAFIRLSVIVANNTCTILIVQHCCGLFSIIRYRMENIQKSIEEDKGLALLGKDDKALRNYIYCIKKHEETLQFANTIETVYMKPLFVEFTLLVICLTFTVLQASIATMNVHLAIRHSTYIMAHLTHIFVLCWIGQQLIDHSIWLYTSTYNSEWYATSSKSKKLLNMIMLRSILPCTLSIGKFSVLSLPTFSAIVRTSVSYFTVLQSIR